MYNQWYVIGLMVGIGFLTSLVVVVSQIRFDSDEPTPVMAPVRMMIRMFIHMVTIPTGLVIFNVILWNMVVMGMGWDLIALTDPAWAFVHVPSVMLGCLANLGGLVSVVFSDLVGDFVVGIMDVGEGAAGVVVEGIAWLAVRTQKKWVWYGGVGAFASVGVLLIGVWFYFFFVTPPPGW